IHGTLVRFETGVFHMLGRNRILDGKVTRDDRALHMQWLKVGFRYVSGEKVRREWASVDDYINLFVLPLKLDFIGNANRSGREQYSAQQSKPKSVFPVNHKRSSRITSEASMSLPRDAPCLRRDHQWARRPTPSRNIL